MSNQNYNSDMLNYQSGGYDDSARVHNVVAKTFLFMFAVLIITAVSAFFTISSNIMLESNIMMPLIIVELVIVFSANFVMNKGNALLSGILLLAYSVVNGMTLSTVFYVYEIGSIASTFVLAALVFGVMAVFGLVTKKDLTSLGSIGMMGLFAVIILAVSNIFIRSDGFGLLISAVGLAVFIGLTAYDVQKIKDIARSNDRGSTTVLAMLGALILYLDFVNIFLRLLRLFGKKN